MDLFKCRRRVGRYANYEAVATWRESTEGRPKEQRDPNLRISSLGIKDFGDGRGYTALDLVMAARGCSLGEAFEWLEERVLAKKPYIEIDIEACASAQAKTEDVSESDTKATDTDAPDMTDDETAVLGQMWEFGDPIPAEEPMLVPVFVPARPLLGFLGGQRSTFKTFVTNDLAVAIASGGEFAGQRVAYPGFVVQIELEGSLSRVRVTAAANHRGVKERLPIWQSNKIPPSILSNRRLNPEWKNGSMFLSVS